ncbi:cytochrome P450 CYP736A12-like protein [Tripterygium wilfordii]|uniref:Cytochrome P450 CYP736A12-like protein n=1 Tax=Tripterygium wilfordii TaxID=458696 RepID=A0A7J7DM76_TRIWF|nr:cytochrome P450 CYP736A12-like protein [Tripterygium wilfordii]
MDTSATAVEWAMSELIRHPRAMKKLQKELKEVVGMNRMVEESDLEKLDYLDMVEGKVRVLQSSTLDPTTDPTKELPDL